MAVYDLCKLADVKAWLALPAAADAVNDVTLQRCIDGASTFFESWLNRHFQLLPYTETRTGKGSKTLMLANRPIVTVTALTINGQDVPASPGFGQRGYWFDDNAIYLRGELVFARSEDPGNVSVGYTSGFAQVPHDIEQACIELVSSKWKERERIGLVSKVLAGETVSYSQKDLPANAQTLLNQYRNVVPL